MRGSSQFWKVIEYERSLNEGGHGSTIRFVFTGPGASGFKVTGPKIVTGPNFFAGIHLFFKKTGTLYNKIHLFIFRTLK